MRSFWLHTYWRGRCDSVLFLLALIFDKPTIIFDFPLAHFKLSFYLCSRERIAGNAEVRPANVSLTGQAVLGGGGTLMVLPLFIYHNTPRRCRSLSLMPIVFKTRC